MRSFRLFAEREDAERFIEGLLQGGFHPELRTTGQVFDVTFTAGVERETHVMLPVEEFVKAEVWLEQQTTASQGDMPPDHYLTGFTDVELREVVRDADAWAPHDRAWARTLLKKRGRSIDDDEVSRIRAERLEDLRRPEKAGTGMLLAAILMVLFGGFVGIVIGWSMRYARKTLPDGGRMFRYTEADRRTGTYIMIAGSFLLVATFMLLFGQGHR